MPQQIRLAVATTTPDVSLVPPVALLSGTFEERLTKAAAFGYHAVELMVLDPLLLDARAISAAVRARGLAIAAIASGAIAYGQKLTLLHPDREMRRRALDRLRALIVFAAEAGAPLVTIGSFRGWVSWVEGDGEAVLHDVLATACAWAEPTGVRLVIEPVNRYELDYLATVVQGLDLIDRIGSRSLGLLVDTFHANIEEPSPEQAVSTAVARQRLWHVHLGDSNRLPPGKGHFDFAGLIAALRAAGYVGYLSAELLARPDADTAARQTAEYILPLLG